MALSIGDKNDMSTIRGFREPWNDCSARLFAYSAHASTEWWYAVGSAAANESTPTVAFELGLDRSDVAGQRS
jgi:hypothetical protein